MYTCVYIYIYIIQDHIYFGLCSTPRLGFYMKSLAAIEERYTIFPWTQCIATSKKMPHMFCCFLASFRISSGFFPNVFDLTQAGCYNMVNSAPETIPKSSAVLWGGIVSTIPGHGSCVWQGCHNILTLNGWNFETLEVIWCVPPIRPINSHCIHRNRYKPIYNINHLQGGAPIVISWFIRSITIVIVCHKPI